VAGRVFDGLWQTLRETDFVGWYQEGRIVGAVLTQPPDFTAPHKSPEIRDRVGNALRTSLGQKHARLLQVNMYQLPTASNEAQNEPWP
jgi:hypothetical protein